MEASRPNAVADPSFSDCTASSLLLELASRDDLDGFRQAVEGCEASSGRKWMDAVGHWYCRCSAHNGACQMGMQERTPMMIAASYGNLDVLSYILESCEFRRGEIDVNRRSESDGSTALHCAAAGGSPSAAEAAALLVENGADVDARDAQGKRPADVMAAAAAAFRRLQGADGELRHPAAERTAVDACRGGIDSDENNRPSSNSLSITTAAAFRRLLGGHDELRDRPEAETLGSAADNTVVDVFRGGIDSITAAAATTTATTAAASERQKPPKTLYPSDPSIPDINSGIYASDEFRMFAFKVRPCSRPYSHDWTECPFVHPGENARRRDPRRYHYSCVPCPDFRKGCCRWGDACEYAHGVFECWLHPAQYRTRLCKDGAAGCTRRVCFFAHTTEELRPLFLSSSSSAAAGFSVASAAALPPPSVACRSTRAAGNLEFDSEHHSYYYHYSSLPETSSILYPDLDPALRRAGFLSHVNERTGSRYRRGLQQISSADDRCRGMTGTSIGCQMQLLLQRLRHSDLQTPDDRSLLQLQKDYYQMSGSGSCSYFPTYPPPPVIGPEVDEEDIPLVVVDACTEKDVELQLLDGIDESLYTNFTPHPNFTGTKSYSLGELGDIDWGSPVGKPEWALTDADLSKLRKSASFSVGKIGTSAVAVGCRPEEEEEQIDYGDAGLSIVSAAMKGAVGTGGGIAVGTGGGIAVGTGGEEGAAATGSAEVLSCCSWITS